MKQSFFTLIYFFGLLFSSVPTPIFAEDCEFFKYCQTSSSYKSINTSTQAIINPSSLAKVKGFGIETLYQNHNPLAFSFVTGNGKFGAALVSSSLENSFFGNRTPELDDAYIERVAEEKRFKSKKLHLGLGVNLLEKKNFSVNLGLSARRNSEIKEINLGAGLNVKFWIFHFGHYLYRDDFKLTFNDHYDFETGIPYTVLYNNSSYQEKFNVATTTFGFNLKNFNFDYGRIYSHYDFYQEATTIYIYAAGYKWKKFFFHLGYRQEFSAQLNAEKGSVSYSRKKLDRYAGVQYSLNKHFVLGFAYNTYLLDELSTTLTLFF